MMYIEGSSFLTEYIIKNCIQCNEKRGISFKREPAKQIITYYPKQRYIMDITELPKDFCNSKNDFLYLLNIIDHFSKFGMSFLLDNKEAKNILSKLKIAFEGNGYPEEVGSDNGREFKNKIIEDFLEEKHIKIIHGMPYNPHSQGVVERFHQTIKDMLYCKYSEEESEFNLKESLDLVVKKYNNHVHSSTKYTPNAVFYSNSKELFSKVLHNIKNTFKRYTKEANIYIQNEKCLLNNKFIIQKKYKQNSVGILKYNRVTNQKIYEKINVTILAKNVNSYKIKIEKDYKKYNLFKGDLYMVNYNLLKKCTENVWNNLLNINKEEDLSSSDDIYENNNVISEDELEFIKDNINELD